MRQTHDAVKVLGAYNKVLELVGFMETIKEIVCRNCKRLLDKSDMKLIEIERLMGVSGSTVQRWKSGVHAPELDKIDKLAKVLNVSRDEFFAVNKKPPIEISITEALRRFQSIDPEVYELAVKVGPNHPVWEDIKGALDLAIEQIEEVQSSKKGARA
jgi:transcriptional regulator with XRE-family HTH domain